jgi:WD domain, G-beta repeat
MGLAFSPDGKRLAAVDPSKVKICDAASGQELSTFKGHAGALHSVAFSPDGTRLAAGGDWTVMVWDAINGQALSTLKGHTNEVTSLAFSPDGTRLASAGMDGTVRLWDAISGRELRTFKGHQGRVMSVAFSPDGMRLASAGDDGIMLWDARTLTPNLQAEREALGLVEFLFGKPLVKAQMFEMLRSNKTISEPVRQKALALLETKWSGVVHQQAVGLLDSLFVKLMPKPEVLESIRNNKTLSEDVRQSALVLAENWRPNPYTLNEESWTVVRKPGAEASAHRLALRQAEEACLLAPEEGVFLNTLGVAQYRAGQYVAAIETLGQSERFNAARFQGSNPADLAFLAMAHYRLGQKEKAQDHLSRLQETMKRGQWEGDAEAGSFLREAEELLQPKSEKTNK